MFRTFDLDIRFALRFRLASFPVALAPSFGVMALILFWGLPLPLLIMGCVALFVCILFHELGHAFALWGLGQTATLQLHAFGGTTHFDATLPRRARILVSLAGPCAGFLLGALLLLAEPLWLRIAWEPWRYLFSESQHICFFWGAVNLLPLPPLDGGHVLEDALGPKRRRLALGIASLTGLLAAGVSVLTGSTWNATFALGLAIMHGARWLEEHRRIRFRSFLEGDDARRRSRFTRWLDGTVAPGKSQARAPNAVPASARPSARLPSLTLPVPVAGQPPLEIPSPVEDFAEAKRLARRGAVREAALRLQRALQGGFEDLHSLNKDPDLEEVRREPEIAALLDPLGLRRWRN